MSKKTRDREERRERRRLWRRVGIWALSGGALAGVVYLIFLAASAPAPSGEALMASPILDSDWTRGNRDAAVTLIEYGDYECPACATYLPIVEQIVKEYGDRIRFAFRDFPLNQHQSARPAAYAAEAAGLQGKYWEMYELLYKNQNDWAPVPRTAKETFESYAERLGLDLARFKSDVESAAVRDAVEKDYQGGIAANVDHTPTFFVNLKQIPNPRNYEDFKSIIEQALAGSL